MIKRAKVISQKPSAAKKGQYLTVLDDGFGELRAYSTRQLKEGEEIVVSVRSGAANDPLAVTILNKRQTENWLKEQGDASVKEEIVGDVIVDHVDKAGGIFIYSGTLFGHTLGDEITKETEASTYSGESKSFHIYPDGKVFACGTGTDEYNCTANIDYELGTLTEEELQQLREVAKN